MSTCVHEQVIEFVYFGCVAYFPSALCHKTTEATKQPLWPSPHPQALETSLWGVSCLNAGKRRIYLAKNGARAGDVQVESSWQVWLWLVLHDGGVIQPCLWEGEFVQTFSPFFPPSPFSLNLSPSIWSGWSQRPHHWCLASSLFDPPALLGTDTAVQQHAHCASPFTPPPPACRYKYEESKTGCFCTTFLIPATLGML